jgi:hypothetical protein
VGVSRWFLLILILLFYVEPKPQKEQFEFRPTMPQPSTGRRNTAYSPAGIQNGVVSPLGRMPRRAPRNPRQAPRRNSRTQSTVGQLRKQVDADKRAARNARRSAARAARDFNFLNGNSVSFGNNTIRAFPSGQSSIAQKVQTASNDEFIANVVGSAAFTTTSYPVNPGLGATFPWGALQAKLYKKYRYRKLQFYYKPTVSPYGNGGQSGKVMLSFNYDASAPPPSNKQIVQDTYPHSDAMPYESCSLNIIPQFQDSMYVRTGSLAMNQDIKTFDLGNLSVSVDGGEDDVEIGELRVYYEIELYNPVLTSEDTTQAQSSVVPLTHCCADFSDLAGTAETMVLGAGTNFIRVGQTDMLKVGNLPLVTPGSGSYSVIVDSPGCYCVDYSLTINHSTGAAASAHAYFGNEDFVVEAEVSLPLLANSWTHTLAGSGMIQIPVTMIPLNSLTFNLSTSDALFTLSGEGLSHLRIMKMS